MKPGQKAVTAPQLECLLGGTSSCTVNSVQQRAVQAISVSSPVPQLIFRACFSCHNCTPAICGRQRAAYTPATLQQHLSTSVQPRSSPAHLSPVALSCLPAGSCRH
jgi:hypothetical protein